MRKCLSLAATIAIAVCVYASGGGECQPLDEVKMITTDKYAFRAVIEGDPEDEPVILLHGFPETSYMWRDLQMRLAGNGYYTIAPDQRGYSPGARPKGRRHYSIDELAADVIGIADSLGLGPFHLIGHDWGSAVGWAVAAAHPERLLSWSAMSVPHLDAFSAAIRSDPAQHAASSYMRAFRWPTLPEMVLKAGDFKRLTTIWDQSTEREIEAYLAVFDERGSLTAALNWYRANYRMLTKGDRILTDVTVPTLFIWGIRDPAIFESGVKLNAQYVSGPYTERFLDAGHWLIQEAFDEVSSLIIEHLEAQ